MKRTRQPPVHSMDTVRYFRASGKSHTVYLKEANTGQVTARVYPVFRGEFPTGQVRPAAQMMPRCDSAHGGERCGMRGLTATPERHTVVFVDASDFQYLGSAQERGVCRSLC